MKNENEIIETGDGSSSLFNKRTGDNYHSKHGAETESSYVFIGQGLEFVYSKKKSIKILEVGFGTGLNAILSFDFCRNHTDISVDYHSLEPYPIENELIESLKFSLLSEKSVKKAFLQMHGGEWGKMQKLSDNFLFTRYLEGIQAFEAQDEFDLIFFDAFGPTYEPDLWEEEVIKKIADLTVSGGVLTSYCAQGQFRRDLENSGFTVDKLPGPPGKREMVRAIKQ